MERLIKFELRKMLRQKTFYVCVGVILLVVVLNVLILYMVDRVSSSFFGDTVVTGLYSGLQFIIQAPSMMQMSILFPIFITLFICNDFSEGTIKNVVSRGFTRTQIYFSKLIASTVAGLIFMVWAMLTAFVAGSLVWGAGSIDVTKMLEGIGVLVLLTVAYVTFDTFLAFLFRKKAGSLAVGIAVSYVVQLICLIVDSIFEFKDMDIRISGYTISSCVQLVATDGPSVRGLIVAFLYIAVFAFGGWFVFRNKEV